MDFTKDNMRGKFGMRSDYSLYSVAAICFVISAVFAANLVPGYQLSDPLGLSVTAIFLVIGIISAAVGFSARPKPTMPTTQQAQPMPKPAVTEPTPEPSQAEPQSSSSPEPEVIAPVPMPSPTPSSPMPEQSVPEPSVPETNAAEPAASGVTAVETSVVTEQPVKVEEPEKPKPARRRRKKTEVS